MLEHCKHPYRVLEEIREATHGQIIVIVPYTWEHESPHHLYSWTGATFENLLRHFFRRVYVYSNRRKHERLLVHGCFKNIRRTVYKGIYDLLQYKTEWVAICEAM